MNRPGARLLTRLLSGAHSTASDLVRLSTPAFAAAECAVPGPPVHEYVAPMLRIAPPPPAARRRRANSVEQKKVPSRTMSVTARHAFGLIFSAGTGKLPAALLINTVTGPISAS